MVIAPKADQNLFSLYITNILSSRRVKRKNKFINLRLLPWSTSKFSKLTFKRMYYDQWWEFNFLVRNLELWCGSIKACFHQRRSHSRSRNQKRRAIRSSEKQTDGVRSRTSHPLILRRLRSIENYIVGVGNRGGKINQSQYSIPGLVIGCFFRFCFQLRQSSFHWIISE